MCNRITLFVVVYTAFGLCWTFPIQDEIYVDPNVDPYSYDVSEVLPNFKTFSGKESLLPTFPTQSQMVTETKTQDKDLLASLVYFLENIPVEECQELPADNARLLMACIGNYIVRRNNHAPAKLLFGKRTETLKFQPTGWKRKRRDVNTPSEEEIETLIRNILQKRQKLRFNPTGW